jgi:hypothetical protein
MKLNIGKLKLIGLFILVIAILITDNAIFNFNDTDYTVTITDKDRIYSKNGKNSYSKYLVFADDENGNSLVFENTDCFIRGKWNSSNMQGELKEGHIYKITVIGYRVPIFSMYQNIIKIEEIE